MKEFKVLEFSCDYLSCCYGNSPKEAIESYAIDQQFEVSFPILLQKEDGKLEMWNVEVVDYENAKYRADHIETPGVEFTFIGEE